MATCQLGTCRVTMTGQGRWLMLIHQVPPEPAYLRVKIWRKLQKLGAVTLKNSVYVLPAGNEALEDFSWLAREIRTEGGEAAVAAMQILEGLTDAEVENLFREARNGDYDAFRADCRTLLSEIEATPDLPQKLRDRHARLVRRLAEIVAIDFFNAPGRDAAEAALQALDRRFKPSSDNSSHRQDMKGLEGQVWVTRAGIAVDRIASAWLIKRFLDPAARFKFVALPYRPLAGEIRFDMFDGEVSHDGDRCTFEMLLERGGLSDPALAAIGEIVHDLDLKDEKFCRPETLGIGAFLAGIAAAVSDDDERLARGVAAFDNLYAAFTQSRR